MRLTKPGRPLFLLAVGFALAALACGIAVKRDFSTIPQGQIGFDDMCGLQDYFDSIEAKVGKEPMVVSAVDLEGGDGHKSVRGGKARLSFTSDFQLKTVRRVLTENWDKLPEDLATAPRIDIEVRWAERAGVRRVLTDREAELFIGDESYTLPYHVCLSEFLYGEPLYRQRRILWGLPSPVRATADAGTAAHGDAAADAGVAPMAGGPRDAGPADAGAVAGRAATDARALTEPPADDPPAPTKKRRHHGK